MPLVQIMTEITPDASTPSLAPARLIIISIFLIIVWGTAFNMISVAVQYIAPIWLVAFRCMLACVLITAYVLHKGYRFPPLRDVRWRWYFFLAMSGIVVPFFLTAKGQQSVDSGVSAILVGAMPLITIILAHFYAHEPLSWRKILGFAIGFGGIILLFMPQNLSLELIANWRAQSLLLLAAFCYAVTTVVAKRAPETASSLGAAMMIFCAAIASLTWALSTGLPENTIPLTGWIMVVGLATGSTAVGTILYLYVIDVAGPTVLARINYFPPVAAVAFGTFFLKEDFTVKMAAAFAVIVLGVIISRSGKRAPAIAETE